MGLGLAFIMRQHALAWGLSSLPPGSSSVDEITAVSLASLPALHYSAHRVTSVNLRTRREIRSLSCAAPCSCPALRLCCAIGWGHRKMYLPTYVRERGIRQHLFCLPALRLLLCWRHEGCGSLRERPGTAPTSSHVRCDPGCSDTLPYGRPHHHSSSCFSPPVFAAPAHDRTRCELVYDGWGRG